MKNPPFDSLVWGSLRLAPIIFWRMSFRIFSTLYYRGISLQSAVLKLYTSILNRRLLFLLETYEVISDLQNDFRPLRTCQDHILTLHNIVLNRKLRGNDTYACFVDFKKAFDSINRDLLWRNFHYMK